MQSEAIVVSASPRSRPEVEIAVLGPFRARTEQDWCPIKHARRVRDAHARYPVFFEHGDAETFRAGLQRNDLSDLARAELHFALGKAHDDAGNYAEAARHFREGNATRHRLTSWSRKAWRRSMEMRLAAPPSAVTAATLSTFTPATQDVSLVVPVDAPAAVWRGYQEVIPVAASKLPVEVKACPPE